MKSENAEKIEVINKELQALIVRIEELKNNEQEIFNNLSEDEMEEIEDSFDYMAGRLDDAKDLIDEVIEELNCSKK
jgi:DNA repair protein RadC